MCTMGSHDTLMPILLTTALVSPEPWWFSVEQSSSKQTTYGGVNCVRSACTLLCPLHSSDGSVSLTPLAVDCLEQMGMGRGGQGGLGCGSDML